MAYESRHDDPNWYNDDNVVFINSVDQDEFIEETIANAVIGDRGAESIVFEGACENGKALLELMAEGIPLDVTPTNYDRKLTVQQQQRVMRSAIALYAQVIEYMRNIEA